MTMKGIRNEAGQARTIGLVFTGICLLFGLLMVGRIVENVSASEIAVIQYPTGTLKFVTTPGPTLQGFGSVTTYPKRSQYEFQLPIRFNDGGHGTMHGSVQWEMPLDPTNLRALHTKFGSIDGIQKSLLQKVVDKSVYMTGPLMSSKESYAEKRNYLINWVEDQISNGVYQTRQHEVRVVDPLTGQEKSAVVVDIVLNNNVPVRQEQSALGEFGIRTFNFTITSLPYDETVEKQIQQQQQITMDVQTAIADARKAEQAAITVEQQGKAEAAKAKWEQEVIKAKYVTEGEQKVAVAKLANLEADQYKEATLKRAGADAEARKMMMTADGALDRKLATYERVQANWATAISQIKVPLVPSVATGGPGGQAGGNAGLNMMELLSIKAAKDLAVDITPGRQEN